MQRAFSKVCILAVANQDSLLVACAAIVPTPKLTALAPQNGVHNGQVQVAVPNLSFRFKEGLPTWSPDNCIPSCHISSLAKSRDLSCLVSISHLGG